MATRKAGSNKARRAAVTPPMRLSPAPPIPQPQPIAQPTNTNATNVWTPIDRYLVRHYGRKSDSLAGQVLASIICYLNGNLIGYLNFYDEDSVPLSAIGNFSPPQIMLVINYPISRIQEVMDTLRLDAPLHVGVDLSQNIGWIGTDDEHVGHVSA